MKHRTDIIVPDDVLAQNDEKRERLDRTAMFQPTDRVPVTIHPNHWVLLNARGRKPGDLVRSPVNNLREQILNEKYRIEHIRDDQPVPTDALSVTPYLGCLRGVEFDMDITWSDDQPPKCTHPLNKPEQIDTLTVPEPDAGLNATYIEWHRIMSDAAADLDVRVNGTPIEMQVTLGRPGGPIPSAFALAGANLFLWMATEPDRVHRLMDIVTTSHMQCIRYFDELMGRDPVHPVGLGADAAEMMSLSMFREFVVPYYLRIWENYPGSRALHNCGKNEHLLASFRDDLGINVFSAFGFCINPDVLAEEFSGRIVMDGGPDPMLIKNGPQETIIAECMRYITTLGTRGGYTLSDGTSTAVGTPFSHFDAMVEASRRLGNENLH